MLHCIRGHSSNFVESFRSRDYGKRRRDRIYMKPYNLSFLGRLWEYVVRLILLNSQESSTNLPFINQIGIALIDVVLTRLFVFSRRRLPSCSNEYRPVGLNGELPMLILRDV